MNKVIDVRDNDFYIALKKSYGAAVKKDKTEFTVNGTKFLTAYAKYLLQHVDNVRKSIGMSVYNSEGKEISPSVDPIIEPSKFICECSKCGYIWKKVADERPVKCPNCQSKRWDE